MNHLETQAALSVALFQIAMAQMQDDMDQVAELRVDLATHGHGDFMFVLLTLAEQRISDFWQMKWPQVDARVGIESIIDPRELH